METTRFDTEMEFAMQHGLTASQALECIAFMNERFPEDLRLHTTYYVKDWIKRRKNDPVAYMDDGCAIIHSVVLAKTSAFMGSL